ncbi:MAG: hypothetical protein HY897_15800 [Deltaproteobacteria bacterium]|nr:hypothetical protein [Deltaproteobacteria bacterium]
MAGPAGGPIEQPAVGQPAADPQLLDQGELASLEAGQAAKTVDAEIRKAERLLASCEPGSGQHRNLSRRVTMLNRLKEKMQK